MAVISAESPKAETEAEPRRVTILGSTGSVGCQTIDIIRRNQADYDVVALTARSNIEELSAQAKEFRPSFVALADPARYSDLKDDLAGLDIEVAAGPEAVAEAAALEAEWVMAAIVGAAGLKPTLAAVERGAIVAFANKECLVCAGELMMSEIERRGATLLPVDSEHNAIFQVFDFDRRDGIEKLILTASGGPFREWDIDRMAKASPEEAVAHPNWDMGAKISVDSATMMNKGLEVIEAHYLFGLPEDKIDVVVHPQSVIHSMVAYVDGSVLAQLGTPDMRTPIAYTLGYPDRVTTPCDRLDWQELMTLTFETPDPDRFPALRIARDVLRAGGSAPIVMNAANEIAVASFLEGGVGFLEIAEVVEDALAKFGHRQPQSLDDVDRLDQEARILANDIVGTRL
ncbi:MAG: 1-deoxy-D-xylulose-5-phosphate reductoisomerase [Rhodospirillaceae bacterium]|nr:1-deoxy-D-xylulose-5-phosphate reductoisomerase [Rhodospirillaceae bacterium]MBL25428.1 1-deoxy-D-xylulose-5-phosphate reductoisomerase [Rhodospirillaceae bacterium]HAA91617.1 1-deoxy-D-xylulose-5-phosphate reductoisomerase [Rhodospirillaceae bacterium]